MEEVSLMPLTSLWFSGNDRLQRCLVSDPEHVKRGDQGMHVLLIQEAVVLLDAAVISQAEIDALRYGPSTANAVLAYKTKRNIINRAYETTADDIVGKMTIAALDAEMRAKEQQLFTFTGLAAPFLRGLFLAPITKKTVNAIVVTEKNAPWFAWAQNFKKTFASIGADLVEVDNSATLQIAANRLELAATKAGPGGFIILNVGHGGRGDASFGNEEGFFDLSPHHTFLVAGRNAVLPGDPPPVKPVPGAKPAQVSAFYDFRVPNPILKGGFEESRRDHDEANPSANALIRLHNFREYEDVGRRFQSIGLSGIILLTCKVGGASGFLKRVKTHFGIPIIGYTRRIVGLQQASGRTRLFLEGDAPGTGTNIPLFEFLFPLSPDMVVF
jgi:hypothetical protein